METMRIRLNTGEVVDRPYREAVSLVSRRLADPVLENDPVPVALEPEGDDTVTGDVVGEVAYTIEDYTKTELQGIAAFNELATSGTKTELWDRLAAADVQLSRPVEGSATPEDVPAETQSSADELD